MTNTELMLAAPERPDHEYFEDTIAIRGCHLSLTDIKAAYIEFEKINQEFGRSVISSLQRGDSMTDQEWEAYKQALLQDGFRLTITISGSKDERVYSENSEVFTSDRMPEKVNSIYFTNGNAYKRHSNGIEPRNLFSILLDFEKPELADPRPLVSEATQNASRVTARADDASFFRAIQRVVDTKILKKRSWYGFLHKNFSYDLGLWLVGLPIALILATHYMDRWLPQSGEYASYRWAFFIYVTGIFVVSYRVLNAYSKWAFPVNVLTENRDAAWKHRFAIATVCGWLAYKVADILFALIFY